MLLNWNLSCFHEGIPPFFGRENGFVFRSSLCERSHGCEGNLEWVPNGENHEGRFVPKPLTFAASDIFSRENPPLGEISQRRHISLARAFPKDKIVNHIQRMQSKKKEKRKKAIETLHSTAMFVSLSSSPERQCREPRLAQGVHQVRVQRCMQRDVVQNGRSRGDRRQRWQSYLCPSYHEYSDLRDGMMPHPGTCPLPQRCASGLIVLQYSLSSLVGDPSPPCCWAP